MLIIRKIHVTYALRTDEANHETAKRVLEFHADFCPVARSIKDSIEITTELTFA